jgi:putative cell wall-binding protein/spore germination protein YaaH
MTSDSRRPRSPFGRLRLAVLLVILAALPSSSAAAVATPAPSLAPTGRAASAAPLPEGQFARRLSSEVYGYLPYWEIDAGTDAYLRYDLLTDIALFSVTVDGNGALVTNAPGYRAITGPYAPAIIANAHAAGVRVDLTFTSFNFDKNTAFFTNPTAMANAVASLAGLVDRLGLDGVSVDVESLYNEQFAAYGAFVGQLRTALRATNPAARVSVATNGNVSGTGMANQALANGADRVFIMGYSYRTAGSSPAGNVAPVVRADGGLSLSTTAALYASKGVPADRILLGLPYFGRTWPTASSDLHAPATGSGTAFFPGEDLPAVPPGTPIGYDDVEHSAWFAVQDPTSGAWSQTYFDNERSLRAKYDYAAALGYAGVGIWTLGYDRGATGYWQAIAGSFGAVRVAGTDRYATAAAASGHVFQPAVDTVYVATGTNFPDALAGVAVAARSGSPILLVTPAGVPAATAAELARLRPRRIVVLGGPGAVGDAVVAGLGPFAAEGVARIGGADRYATAAGVSADAFPAGAPVAYVVSGATFPDAVSAGPAAARDGGPVLLTAPATLSAPTAAELARLAPARVVLVGGPGAVLPDVEAAIRALLPSAVIERLAGPDRYATSAAVAATFAPGGAAVFLAIGTNFPDALAGGAAAGALGSPVVLAAGTALAPVTAAELTRLAPRRAVVLGGPTLITDAVVVAVRGILAAQ